MAEEDRSDRQSLLQPFTPDVGEGAPGDLPRKRVSFKDQDVERTSLVHFGQDEIVSSESDAEALLQPASSSSDPAAQFDVEAQQPVVTKERISIKDKDIEARRSVALERARSFQARLSSGPVLLRRSSMAHVRERVREVPPEWALLLMGCFLGFSTGLAVVLFVRTEHLIHDFAWAGTPEEGAAWLREQKLADTWHRLMLVPVSGGIVVGVMHTLLSILDQVKASRTQERRGKVDYLAASVPAIKAMQAAVTLGTGNSLGPEGPSVDIGKACAHGCSELMKNNRERRIALVAAGAAAGIAAGFNAPVSGCFFAIETVLRPLHAENSPPLTTAMIILASVISSTVSQVLNGEKSAFTVPTYELRSAAELPLYLMLGMLCGVVSVIFTRLVAFFTGMFEFVKERVGIPLSVTPAMGGLGIGLLALAYPGVLYWGFTNVNEIMHSGKDASAPGTSLLTQLVIAKVVSTAFSKGSALVGGVYAPSLFIGSALGSVYGSIMGTIINAAIPNAVAHPQAYALVGMAAMLAAVCSVPLTSVLLLFELTKDYHILLPLLGAVGLAFWVASVAKQKQIIGIAEDLEMQPSIRRKVWRRKGETDEVELCTVEGYIAEDEIPEDELLDEIKVAQAMTKTYVKVQATATVKEAVAAMLSVQQRCVIVVDDNELLEGIMTLADLHKEVIRAAMATSRGDVTVLEVDSMLVAAICTGQGRTLGDDNELLICYPDMTLKMAQQLMEQKRFHQLPVVSRAGQQWQERGRKVVGLFYVDTISATVRYAQNT
ncbi:hypothetical protein SELMODRAFT_80641 [Selaginella moellendorffii]|uniref:Chloride channel protein n=1 Tax=Selaginella moellendorffii TaxID=88036 RepID=D8QXL5_SELML|nr:hypothetical protein SELMODRAFT_80641 [Selaginella moellendorffii]